MEKISIRKIKRQAKMPKEYQKLIKMKGIK